MYNFAYTITYSEYFIYRASHIILDYLQSLTPKYAHNTDVYMYNHMVGRTASIISPFYSLLPCYRAMELNKFYFYFPLNLFPQVLFTFSVNCFFIIIICSFNSIVIILIIFCRTEDINIFRN